MSPESFVYWLQGCFEIHDLKSLDEKQTQIIKDHLNLVLSKQTPDRNKIPFLEFTDIDPNINPLHGKERKFCAGLEKDIICAKIEPVILGQGYPLKTC